MKALANVKNMLGTKGKKHEMRRFGRNVSALGKLLNKRFGIDSYPFNKKELFWSPKFKIKQEKDDEIVSRDPKTVEHKDWMK